MSTRCEDVQMEGELALMQVQFQGWGKAGGFKLLETWKGRRASRMGKGGFSFLLFLLEVSTSDVGAVEIRGSFSYLLFTTSI